MSSSSAPTSTILIGDVREKLRELPDESVHCCVTSPPYFGLRSYNGGDAEIGQEATPQNYIDHLVDAFREVRRVLRTDGTLWLNLGDSYAGGGKGGQSGTVRRNKWHEYPESAKGRLYGMKPKDLMLMPHRVAMALQQDGWWLRMDVVWSKRTCLPESVRDRPTRSHEYIFLLTRSATYHYDAEAIAEPAAASSIARVQQKTFRQETGGPKDYARTGVNANRSARKTLENWARHPEMRNKRSVWEANPQPYPEAHFAVFPEAIVEPCVLAGCPESGTVLDPFCGSGTALAVAVRLGRNAIGIELNAEYAALAEKRLRGETTPLPLWEETA